MIAVRNYEKIVEAGILVGVRRYHFFGKFKSFHYMLTKYRLYIHIRYLILSLHWDIFQSLKMEAEKGRRMKKMTRKGGHQGVSNVILFKENLLLLWMIQTLS